jgi:hypothetical protein
MYIGGLGRLPKPPRLPSGRLRWPSPYLSVLGSALIADNENSGVNSRTLDIAGGAAGVLLLTFVGIRTSIFAGPPTANNGNTYTQEFSQDFGPAFPQYSLRGYRVNAAAGGSSHTATVTKSSGDAEELTLAGIAISRGSIVSSSVVNRTAAGAGATHVSGNVTATGPALLVAVGSGSGDVNATAPTQTWPSEWTQHQAVARSIAQAPEGHVPLYLMTRAVGVGTHNVEVQVAINEGIVLSLYAVQA